ncbi:MAG TPA: sodium:proton antiporter [Spirochaetota bacterium]|nr:sodium:proton antiporter [Spirochaetota bacterium]HPJ43508.1 sodium:proton antiporter [Spirochaetota bacterium]HPR37271.1 sodium:proton antiporter [Spirochaetota bacterium]HRX46938.1 sodium:proton antiporter [Spirochaetota bacterium]
MKKTVISIIAIAAIITAAPLIFHARGENPSSGDHSIAKTESVQHEAKHDSHGAEGEHHAPHIDAKNLSLLWIIPFVGILLSIALMPLLIPHFWHHHYGKVSLFWWVVFFSAFSFHFGFNTGAFYLLEVYLLEFIPFITLLLALFTVAGGIQLKGDLAGSPKVNTLMILIGGVLASFMGTTGAAMVMIRPILKANEWRKNRVHIVVFVIFVVANVGGGLTPLGDPPLFLGFLKGVDFFWTTVHMLPPMAFVISLLLIIFFFMDTYYYKKEKNQPDTSGEKEKLQLVGVPNMLLLPCIIVAVLASSMDLGIAFTLHYVDVPTASILQVSLLLIITFVSLKISKKEIRVGNGFNWEPIREVAKLFATIFMTMVTPIAMLKAGADGPMGAVIKGVVDSNGEFINSHFFWATGILSSFLDNAPTYLVFFNTAGGNPVDLMGVHAGTLLAISAGAVFMGANTYIGNAPNFMTKAIAEENGVPMPSFFGYMIKYSIPILIPVFILVTFVFF